MDFLNWLQGSVVADAITRSVWMYPAFESLHYVGIALLLGSIIVIDLRLLGFARRLPVEPVIGLLPWVWVGFLINVTTGSLLFTYGATSFGLNRMFWLKMGLLLLAGLNAVAFKVLLDRSGRAWMSGGAAPAPLKVVATLSLLLWVGVTTAGRFMAYV